MLLLDTTRTPYGESNGTITFDIIVTLKDQCQGHSNVERLYLVNELI